MDEISSANFLLKISVFILDLLIVIFNMFSFQKRNITTLVTTQSVQTTPEYEDHVAEEENRPKNEFSERTYQNPYSINYLKNYSDNEFYKYEKGSNCCKLCKKKIKKF